MSLLSFQSKDNQSNSSFLNFIDSIEYKSYFEKMCYENYGTLNLLYSANDNLKIGFSLQNWPFFLISSTALVVNIFIIIVTIRSNIKKNQNDDKKEKLLKRNSTINSEEDLNEDENDSFKTNKEIEEMNKKQLGSKIKSLDKMLFLITIIETFIAFFWLLFVSIFNSIESLHKNCQICFSFSIITIFLQWFDWIFFACCLYNLLYVIKNPIGEMDVKKRLIVYIIISLTFSGSYLIMVLFSQIQGISPMLTCFIKNTFNDPSKEIPLYISLILPFIYISICFLLLSQIIRSRKLVISIELKEASIKLLIISILYTIFYFPTFLLYITTINSIIKRNSFNSWLSYYCSLSGMFMNLIFGISRTLERYCPFGIKDIFDIEDKKVSYGKFDYIFQENINNISTDPSDEDEANCEVDYDGIVITSDKNRLTPNSGETDLTNNKKKTQLYKLSQKKMTIIESFMRDLFIGITLSLFKSQAESPIVKREFSLKVIQENKERKFNSLEPGLDEVYYRQYNLYEYFEKTPMQVIIIEHSPMIFKQIRKIDNLSENELTDSLLKSNVKGLSTGKGGKSGALFISTLNENYILKTMIEEDYSSVMSNSFLTYYILHFENNIDSLICKFYGIYSIKSDENSNPFKIILMRNAKGPFKKYIRKCFDLKGSTMNRKTNTKFKGKSSFFDVKKDINFNNEIGQMNLVDYEKERFLKAIHEDVNFLVDLELMDYSLFLMQIKMNDSEYESLVSDEAFDKYKKYLFKSKGLIKDEEEVYEEDFLLKRENVYYVVMVIDFLQQFTINKQFEKNFKGIFQKGIASSAPPMEYSIRFLEYCHKIV